MADPSSYFDPSAPLNPTDAKLDYSVALPTQRDIIKQQLARAEALRGSSVPQPASVGWGGGLAAGLAGGVNKLVGGLKQNQLFKQMQGLVPQEQADRRAMDPLSQQQAPAQPAEALGLAAPDPAIHGIGPDGMANGNAIQGIGPDSSQQPLLPGQQPVGMNPALGPVSGLDPSMMNPFALG
jgi:hypothetical protein